MDDFFFRLVAAAAAVVDCPGKKSAAIVEHRDYFNEDEDSRVVMFSGCLVGVRKEGKKLSPRSTPDQEECDR